MIFITRDVNLSLIVLSRKISVLEYIKHLKEVIAECLHVDIPRRTQELELAQDTGQVTCLTVTLHTVVDILSTLKVKMMTTSIKAV